MDTSNLFAPSPEAPPFSFLSEHPIFDEDNLNPREMSELAVVDAFRRYLSGADLFVVPTTRVMLQTTLRRYAADALHNTISQSRFKVAFGGGTYRQILELVSSNLEDLLNKNEILGYLLGLHCPTQQEQDFRRPRAIKTN